MQPFIENSLLHGLLHKKGHKKLTVTFHLSEKLTCTIIDNGVGRKRAKEIQERQGRGHESFALNAIKQRLAILSEKSNEVATFTTTDLYENGEPVGTKAEVTIPFRSAF